MDPGGRLDALSEEELRQPGLPWLYFRPQLLQPLSRGSSHGNHRFALLSGRPWHLHRPGKYLLTFERGPSQALQLQWATYFDAADQAGLSRLWGGIHVSVDDLTGRLVGSQCGRGAWNLARKYFDGSIANTPVTVAIRALTPRGCELRFDTLRGFIYRLQSTRNLAQPFADEVGNRSPAADTAVTLTELDAAKSKFYRVVVGP